MDQPVWTIGFLTKKDCSISSEELEDGINIYPNSLFVLPVSPVYQLANKCFIPLPAKYTHSGICVVIVDQKDVTEEEKVTER